MLRPDGTGRWLFDLPAANRLVLRESGLRDENIHVTQYVTGTGVFFSDRSARPCGRLALVARLRTGPQDSSTRLQFRATQLRRHPPVSVFRYQSYSTDAVSGLLTCRYSLDDDKLGTLEFTERVTLAPGPGWDTPQAQAAARLVFLLAGVSYYKTGAPGVIDLGESALTAPERGFLRDFYLQGLGEYAYRNNLDLSALEIRAPEAPAGAHRAAAPPPALAIPGKSGMPDSRDGLRALIPFGGGIDSIVTVEKIRALAADCALFVVSKPGARFDAIEAPAAVAGLPVVRAGREIDPQLLRSAELGFRNGHVPVTGIISAIAILAAVLAATGRRGHVQRVVGVGADAGARRQAGQPPVLQERVLRGGVPCGPERSASAEHGAPEHGAGDAARVLLRAARPHRAVGGRGVRGAAGLPRDVPQL